MKIAALVALVFVIIAVVTASDEKRVVLEPPSSVIGIPLGWLRTSNLKREEIASVPLIIALKHPNPNQLQTILDDVSDPASPHYGQYLTVDQITEIVAPSVAVQNAVEQWLQSYSPVRYSFNTNRDFITVDMPLQHAESMLQCTFDEYVHKATNTRILRCPASTLYTVPEAIAPHLDFIAGVHRFPNIRSALDNKFVGVDAAPQTTPAFIRSLYNITVPKPPQHNLQAVVSFLGQFYTPSDLTKFQVQFGTPVTPIEKTFGPNDPTKPGVEASLDVQYLTGVTGAGLGTKGDNIRTWVYSTPGNRSHDDEPFLHWLVNVVDNPDIPYVFSISYQDYEYWVNPTYARRVSEEFAKLGARGRTLVTGSGDWGVGCQSDFHSCTRFVADFPSSSPNIVSTGATYIVDNTTENGVSFSSGGFSYYFDQPAWQKDAVSSYLRQSGIPPSSFFNAQGRAFPDVAAIGTLFQVFYNGAIIPVGGTSASTPTFAAMLSLINSMRLASNLPTLGHVNPFLYKATSAFKDITQGQTQAAGCCSRSFACTQGWDPYTGLGTPDFAKLSKLAMSSDMFPSFAGRM